MRQNSVRRRLAGGLALIVAVTGLAVAPSGPAQAAPRPLAAPGDNGDDGEGGSKKLLDQLEEASEGFLKAKDDLAASKKRQVELVTLIKQIDTELGPRQATLNKIAGQTYRAGRLGPIEAVLTASSTGDLIDRARTLETVALEQDRALRDLRDTRARQDEARKAVEAEIKDQQKQVTLMAKRKEQAEGALKAANQGASAGGSNGANAASAAGFAGGSGCRTDPTGTGGCITPRLLHSYNQARAAGFKRFTKCWRQQSSGEHGKGRACDFSANNGSFGGDAVGASKNYGDNLAGYFIKNSSKLGVLYVIWYRRIWLPSSGWKSYSGAGGDPSSDHTNHVHLSVR